jgi:hypothetical protein
MSSHEEGHTSSVASPRPGDDQIGSVESDVPAGRSEVSDGLTYNPSREVDKIQLKEKESLTSVSSGPHSNDALSNYDRVKALVKKERLGHQKNVELVTQQMKLEPEGETRQYSHINSILILKLMMSVYLCHLLVSDWVNQYPAKYEVWLGRSLRNSEAVAEEEACALALESSDHIQAIMWVGMSWGNRANTSRRGDLRLGIYDPRHLRPSRDVAIGFFMGKSSLIQLMA